MNIEDLSPELVEKAKVCSSVEELTQLAKENGVELSDGDLEAISGGGWECWLRDCHDFHPY